MYPPHPTTDSDMQHALQCRYNPYMCVQSAEYILFSLY
jgi:hypothetical protein